VGKSGAGKSRAGEYLSRQFDVRHIKTGTICRQISRLLFDNEDKASTQRIDDALTVLDGSIFLRAALRSVQEQEGFVIDALRFRGDMLLARDYHCKVIRIVAPDEVRIRRLQDRHQVFDPVSDGAHRSEIELDQVHVDFEVVNDGDLKAFDDKLSAIVAKV
jgi:dephospho-CoA kinase